MNFLTYIFVLINLGLITSSRLYRGRPLNKHGMLGLPKTGPKFYEISKLPEAQWFDQKLNHFDPVDDRTWKQRFFINDTFFAKDGPIFLQLGGEGEANPIWVVEGQIAKNYGNKFNAMSVLLEHRYYGKSHPTPDMSVENLRYLTSEQALQDAAYFIEYLSSKLNLTDNKWVVFGGSYSGSLAAWFRAKYPHLVVGAVASSAPVEALINFKDYLAVVSRSLGQECDQSIREATTQLGQELKRPLGWRALETQFQLCDPLNGTDTKDVYNLVSTLAGNFEGVVQYNKDNRDFEGALATNITIDVICGVMTDTSTSALDRYAKVNDMLLKAYSQKCVDFKYENFIKQMVNTNWNSSASEGGRQWTYQTCVEFGFFQSSDLKSQPFGPYFPVEFFIEQCSDIFGPKYNRNLLEKAVEFTNNFYGGFDLKVRKVLFPNGSIDPWHALGIIKDLNQDSKALLINGTAHCADMYPESDSDSQELKNARIKIMESLGEFLS